MIFPQEAILPKRVIFRKGCFSELPVHTSPWGRRGLIIHGRSFNTDNAGEEKVRALYSSAGTVSFFCRGKGEPTVAEIQEVLEMARSLSVEWIVGIGGGSALDLAKAAAGLFHEPQSPSHYFSGGKILGPGIPFVAVPTTAGSGAEATPNAVIIDQASRVKRSIRHPSFLAETILLDVDMLRGISSTVLSHSGMDAFVQAYEASISKNATWFSDMFAGKALQLINDSIVAAVSAGTERHLSMMLLGSFFAGIALASARLGVIHGLAHPLGALYGVPHGLICAAALPVSIRFNKDFMGDVYGRVSAVLNKDLAARVDELLVQLSIASPFKGKAVLDEELIIRETLSSGSTAANPRVVTRDDVVSMLRELF